MTLFPLPAFNDNYIWVLHDGRHGLVVDPGESEGVLRWLDSEGITLDAILVTHHHGDHTGGVDVLRLATGARVIGPAREVVPEPIERASDGDTFDLLGLRFEVLDVPGHTAGHIAYHCADVDERPLLFCGDTLFSAGCGRLFEGTPEQMLASLDRLAALPDNTMVCCTHEYTLSNLRFARAVDPDNGDLQAYEQHCLAVRARNLPTLPSSIGQEKKINPFLRVRVPALSEAARRHAPETPSNALGVFTTLRAWKNVFQ